MTRLSNKGTQCIPQKVLTFSREVDECKPLLHGLDTLSRTTLYTQVVRSPGGRQPVAALDRTTHPRPAHHASWTMVGRCSLTVSNPR